MGRITFKPLIAQSAAACRCDACGMIEEAGSLRPIEAPGLRLEAGAPCPAGECTACGALSYLVPAQGDAAQGGDVNVQGLANDALDAACLLIQRALGVTDGGLAALVFSDGKAAELLCEYIRSEIAHASPQGVD